MNILMKTFMACLVLALCTTANADIVWTGAGGGAVTDNSANTSLDTFTTGSGFQSPTLGVNGYSNASVGGNAEYFAAISDTGATFNVFNGNTNDLLGRTQSGSQADAMLAWDSSGESMTLTTMGVTGFGGFGASNGNARYHYIFQDSLNAWHASEVLTAAGNTSAVASLSWTSFTPHSGGVATVSGTSTTPSFDNTQLVGVYYEKDLAGGAFFTGFNSTFTAVPEPSSLALFGLLGLGLFRRKRN